MESTMEAEKEKIVGALGKQNAELITQLKEAKGKEEKAHQEKSLLSKQLSLLKDQMGKTLHN